MVDIALNAENEITEKKSDQHFYPPPPTKSEGGGIYLCRRPCVIPSVHCAHPSVHIFVRPEPYLSTHWSDLMHSWYENLVPWTVDILSQYLLVRFDAFSV